MRSRSHPNCRPQRYARKNPRGFTIVEMLLAISMSVFVLATAGELVHKMFSHQQVATADARFHITTDRLSRLLRNDASGCDSCTAEESRDGIKFESIDGSTIRYFVDKDLPNLIHRSHIPAAANETDAADDSDRETSLPPQRREHLDHFRLPASASARFELEDDAVIGSRTFDIAKLMIGMPDPTKPFYDSHTTVEGKSKLVIEAITNPNTNNAQTNNAQETEQSL